MSYLIALRVREGGDKEKWREGEIVSETKRERRYGKINEGKSTNILDRHNYNKLNSEM